MHGGDIYRNKIKLDFSVNVNPILASKGVRDALLCAADKCAVYPDIRQEALKESIAEMTGVGADDIICGNGASELFVAVMHALRPKKVLIPVPSFSGYERAVKTSDAKIVHYRMNEERGFSLDEDFPGNITDDIDMLFLANPNNPTGALIKPELLAQVLELCCRERVTVVLDEAFIEFTCEAEKHSFFHRAEDFPGLIVVRAFTKFFAMPGVRLGYLTASDKRLQKKIAAQLPEWNLSVFAQEAGIAAVKDSGEYLRAAKLLGKEREYMAGELSAMGCKVYKSDVNYLLFYSDKHFYESLLAQGILIRDCSDYKGLGKGYYRTAVRFRQDNEKLIAAMWGYQI